MRIYDLSRRRSLCIAVSLSCLLATIAVARDANAETVAAFSGIVTGNVQQVGFRAMIQKQAIRYDLAGSAENNADNSVRFVLQGSDDRIDKALKIIREGTKKSSNVKVSVSKVPVDSGLKTFTVVGWTSLSRGITHPYDLVFNLRPDDTKISKAEAKKVWLDICETDVTGEDKKEMRQGR